MTTKNTELGLKGEGAEPVIIPEVSNAVENYIKVRDAFVATSRTLQERQADVRTAMHNHEDKLSRNGDGALVYRFDDMVVTVAPGKEKVKVKEIEGEEE